MAVDFTETNGKNEYVIFLLDGKTMIGKFHVDEPAEIAATGGVHASLMGDTSDYYYVENPAEIEMTLTIPPSGSADLFWKIKPMFYNKDLVGSSDSLYTSAFFTIPKSKVSLSNIGGTAIDATLLSAYKSLCE